jgi:hypothetical protein
MKIWRNQDTPFYKYKDVTKKDWARFVEKCELAPYLKMVQTSPR